MPESEPGQCLPESEPGQCCARCDSEESPHWYTVRQTDGDDRTWCEDCYSSQGCACARCDEDVDADDSCEVGGDYWCSYCTDEYSCVCHNCSSCVSEDNAGAVYGPDGAMTWCSSCQEEDASVCARCAETTSDACIRTVLGAGGEVWWCESCIDSFAYTCERCDMLAEHASYTHPNHHPVCRTCADEYTVCAECDVPIEDDHTHERSDGAMCCARCVDSRPSEGAATTEPPSDREAPRHPQGVQRWNWRPSSFTFFVLPHETTVSESARIRNVFTFGTEVEMECTRYDKQHCAEAMQAEDEFELLYAKHDGSIADGGAFDGFEAVSMPASWGWARRNRGAWQPMFNLRKMGCRSYNTENCGMHVHIGRASFRTPSQERSTLHLFKFSKFLLTNNHFVHRISRRNQMRLKKWAKYMDEDTPIRSILTLTREGGGSRNSAVNFNNLDTVECRIFRGTLNETGFWANIEFLKAVFDYTLECGVGELLPEIFIPWVWERENQYRYLLKVHGRSLPAAQSRV